MNTFTPGIVIDCSHLSAADLDCRVVEFAASLGWTGGVNDLDLLFSDWDDYNRGVIPPDYSDEEDFIISYREALAFACDDAVEWLNDEMMGPEGVYWTIDDNSLYLWEDEN